MIALPLPPHGSPMDRGSADRYYGRDYRPHYHLKLPTGSMIRIGKEQMTSEQVLEYKVGWENEEDRKDWG